MPGRPAPLADRARLDLLIVGHTNIDRILQVARLPDPDRTVPVLGETVRLGGTAANLARSAARQGLRVGLVSLVGADFPPEFVTTLRREKVDVEGVEQIPGAHTPSCTIFEDGKGSQMTAFRQGPMDNAGTTPVRPELFRGATWVHLTTGDPAFQLRFAETARRHGLHVAVDPAQEIHYRWDGPRLRRLVGQAEILFGNRAEIGRARRLLGRRTVGALTDLVPLVVMTDGPAGARSYSRAGRASARAVPLRGRSQVTGAGDAFRGGFYAGWLHGKTVRDCLAGGCRASADWMTSHDAPAPRKAGGRSA